MHAKNIPVKLQCGVQENGLSCALKLSLPEGYHSYSHDTVDAGRPTEIELTVEQTPITSLFYPKGAAQRDLFSPETSVFIYEGDTYLFADLPLSAKGKEYHGYLSLLLCSKRHCIPVNQELKGRIPEKLPQAKDE
ncbi:MAG: cytochrome C biosynthesis protein, partial [Desulfovibrio sp.]|nr:cytochrome C biosynthesis protein [Desulfovibrio sp.]